MAEKMITRYGKPISGVYSVKQPFFKDNAGLFEQSEQFRNVYIKQPIRKGCKICGQPLPLEPYYICHKTPFFLCGSCGHLNGKYDDNKDYTDALYTSGVYGEPYYDEDKSKYIRRMETIYIPKVQFLIEALEAAGTNYKDFHYLDVGTGAGFMVGAYDQFRLNAHGIDISKTEIEYGKKMLGENLLSILSLDQMEDEVAHTRCEVVSFIGVLEHMVNINEILFALKENPNIKYIYVSVPKFSLSCIFEIVFPEVYPRQIGGGGGHTHLFTDESLDWICNKYQFAPIAKWQFGTDIMDLYRSLYVMLEKYNASQQLISDVSNLFGAHTDALQMVLDKTNLASETHLVLKKL